MTQDTQNSPPPLERHRSLPAVLALIAALALLLILVVVILLPFIAPIVCALVLTAMGYPLYAWILRQIGEKRRGIASALTCFALLLVLIGPLGWIARSVVVEATQGAEWADRQLKELKETETYKKLKEFKIVKTYLEDLEDLKENLRKEDEERVEGEVEVQNQKTATRPPPGDGGGTLLHKTFPVAFKIAGWFTGTAAGIFANLLNFLFKFCLMFFILFFFLKDGPQLLRSIQRSIPLELSYQQKVVDTFRKVSRSIIWGSIGTALAQGVAATLAFLIVGIPPIFYGVLATFCALIPGVGTALVTVPVIIFLLASKEWFLGIFMCLAAVGIAGLDNVIRPILVGKSLKIHPIWLALSILGAVLTFGPMGLIYGPLILVLLGTVLALFVQEEQGIILTGAREAQESPAPESAASGKKPG